jgi:hypothetical protein
VRGSHRWRLERICRTPVPALPSWLTEATRPALRSTRCNPRTGATPQTPGEAGRQRPLPGGSSPDRSACGVLHPCSLLSGAAAMDSRSQAQTSRAETQQEASARATPCLSRWSGRQSRVERDPGTAAERRQDSLPGQLVVSILCGLPTRPAGALRAVALEARGDTHPAHPAPIRTVTSGRDPRTWNRDDSACGPLAGGDAPPSPRAGGGTSGVRVSAVQLGS